MQSGGQFVSGLDVERLRGSVKSRIANPHAGIFGPASVSWKIDRESALFLGAGRAALMQLAHPWVATALDQHSNLRADPLARFHNTFRVVFTMVFGTLDQALAASQYVYRLHARVQGSMPETVAAYAQGSHYRANEVSALVWVFATLVESAVQAYDCVFTPLSQAEREAYYFESKLLAALFGIPSEALPTNWQGFNDYLRGMIASGVLGVNASAREMARRVLSGTGSWVPVPSWYRALTVCNMPASLREEFHLAYGRREAESATRAQGWLARIYPHLPEMARFVGPYHEATRRLAGRPVTAITRLNNRFWMGQSQMMFGPIDRCPDQI